MKRSKLKKIVDEHDLYDTVIKITPFLRRQFIRYSGDKGNNVNNVRSLAHGIRLAGVALARKYGVKEPEKLCVNYQ
jgi:hypothetical protein